MIRIWFATHRATIFHWSMEVIIVVIGILIAFALQDWSQDLSARRRAVAAEKRIRAEIVDNSHDFVERLAVYPCLRARIAELTHDIVVADPAWRPSTSRGGSRRTVLPVVYNVPSRSSVADVYRGALADGDLAATSAELRTDFARLYIASERLDQLNLEENRLADQLQPLQLTGASKDGDRRAALAALARLDSINSLTRLMAQQFLKRLPTAGYRFSAAEVEAAWEGPWSSNVAYGRERYGSCWDRRAFGALIASGVPR